MVDITATYPASKPFIAEWFFLVLTSLRKASRSSGVNSPVQKILVSSRGHLELLEEGKQTLQSVWSRSAYLLAKKGDLHSLCPQMRSHVSEVFLYMSGKCILHFAI